MKQVLLFILALSLASCINPENVYKYSITTLDSKVYYTNDTTYRYTNVSDSSIIVILCNNYYHRPNDHARDHTHFVDKALPVDIRRPFWVELTNKGKGVKTEDDMQFLTKVAVIVSIVFSIIVLPSTLKYISKHLLSHSKSNV